MTQPNGISVDGNSLVISNCTITFNNAFDPTTGVASITITPLGGLGTLPGVLEGQPGPPPTFRNINYTQLAFGESGAGASFTEIAPGGPGTSSIWDLDLSVNSGAPGDIASFLLTAAEDVVGTLENWFTVLYDSADNVFNLGLPPIGVKSWPTVANSTSGTGAGPRTLGQTTIAAQPWASVVTVSGQTLVSGTVNTQVNVTANIGSASGQQVGAGFGAPGQAKQSIILSDGPPAGTSTSAVQIAKNTSATIVFSATQVGSNTDAWSTTDTTTVFSVTTTPVLL